MSVDRRKFLNIAGAAIAGLALNPEVSYSQNPPLISFGPDSTSRHFYAGRDTTAIPDSASGLFHRMGTSAVNQMAHVNSQSSLEDILKRGTDAFFDSNTGAAYIAHVDGKPHLFVPWYASSSEKKFHTYGGKVQNPSLSNYAMVTDELGELAMLVSIGDNPQRMEAAYNTIEAMRGSHGSLPGWVANVRDNRISLFSTDSASDASARFILALYQAAKNPNFSVEDQARYKEKGDLLARDHMQYEYARDYAKSNLTGRTLDMWAAGGGNTAKGGINNLNMFIGYFPDIIKALLAAEASTKDPAFGMLAEDVAHQFLLASNYNGRDLSVGRVDFGWDTSSGLARPRVGWRGNYFWEPQNPAWDEADAPRALWIGDVLRAAELSGRRLNGMFGTLAEYSDKILRTGTQTIDKSVVQYFADGRPMESSRRGDYFALGFGAGIHTHFDRESMQPLIENMMRQFDFSRGVFYGGQYLGVYGGARPFKAIATALNKDAGIYVSEPATNSEGFGEILRARPRTPFRF